MKYIIEFLWKFIFTILIGFVLHLIVLHHFTNTDLAVLIAVTILWQGIPIWYRWGREQSSVEAAVKAAEESVGLYKRKNDWRNIEGDVQVDYPIKRKRGQK